MTPDVRRHGTCTGSTRERLAAVLATLRDRETHHCCGRILVGPLDAENHLVFIHGIPRLEAREAVVRLETSVAPTA